MLPICNINFTEAIKYVSILFYNKASNYKQKNPFEKNVSSNSPFITLNLNFKQLRKQLRK